ncbi:sperm flagellar protein 1 isoform X2 [Polyodon spathula]|uniref:sperm flagellar protein 1 isoform X2 n=1 Tax=Polyodon spathula TaxID=7913 RepID=UPI001B7E118D|nr:sperm flagellar protein 1 isoform X2 [Polyodon spathula]
MNSDENQETLQELYAWIDQIPLSRPKRNIARDFGDGDLHNYIPANSTQQKLSNWGTLNRKVFSKFNFHVPEETVKKIILSTNGVIETVLCTLRDRIEEKRAGKPLTHIPQGQLQDLGYYSITDQKPSEEYVQIPMQSNDKQSNIQMQKQEEWKCTQRDRLGHKVNQYGHLDPSVRLLMEEKEQALLSLQETVEILQMKVHRLEHLVQLKDLRIEDLTKHLEKYKSRPYIK